MSPGRYLAATILLGCLAAPALGAVEPHVTRLVVAVEGPYVRLTFDLEGAFNDQLVARIEGGLASGFGYDIELLRDRKHFWDERVARARLMVTASYDPVARTYLARYELDGRLVDSRAVKSRADLQRAMTHISSLPVFETRGLLREERYIVTVRAEAGDGVLLGLFARASRTEWIESRKFRVPAPAR